MQYVSAWNAPTKLYLELETNFMQTTKGVQILTVKEIITDAFFVKDFHESNFKLTLITIAKRNTSISLII